MVIRPVVKPVVRSVIEPVLRRMGLLNWRTSSLFAANEPGLSYDTDDLTTMFVDAAGATPATVNGLCAANDWIYEVAA